MKNRAIMLMVVGGLLTWASVAHAQPKGTTLGPIKPMASKAADVAPQAGKFSDEEMSQVAAALTGSWKCTEVPNAGAAGNAADVVMSVAPVGSKDMPDLLYAELSRGDSLNRPYRQAIWQLHRVQGKLRLKTLVFRRERGELLSAAGLWAAPDAFPEFGNDDLVATLDIELAKSGSTWKGKTLHSYPTSMGGAVEMTSEVSISPESFVSSDRGTDADGKEVWGPPAKSAGFAFKKFDPGVKVHRLNGGVVVVDFPSQASGPVAKAGDKLMIQYSGYLANGWMFDSSFERGSPLTYVVGSRFVEGWRLAMMDAQKGMQRKLVIPGALGFGQSGELRGKVPANATLYIDVQVVDLVPGSGAIGMTPGGNTTVKPMDPNSPEAKRMMETIKKKQAEAAAATSDKPPKR